MSRSYSGLRASPKDKPVQDALPEIMTADQVAAFLGVNRKTIYSAIRAGRRPGKRIGKRRVVISWPALIAWLSS